MSDGSPSSDPARGESPALREVSNWERDVVERLAFESLTERRRARRWKLAFRFSILSFMVLAAVFWLGPEWSGSGPSGPHTALVDVRGVISETGGESAERIVSALRAAFEDSETAGVIIRINSPGGSPVQAGYVNDEIVRLRKLHPDTPIYAVIADIAVSGGYYIAAAADEIYASRSSLVGSIGVQMNGFGFVGTMEKLGVERRLLTAGNHKGFLDPFSPTREEEVAHVTSLLEDVHHQFIEVVKRGRGDRLSESEDVYSGLIWTGSRAIELGLVDALGSSSHVAREVIGAQEIVNFTPRPSHLEAIAEHFGAGVARILGTSLGLAAGRLN